jgi:hypothetical protein
MRKETVHIAITAVLGVTACVLGGVAYKFQQEAADKEQLLKTVVAIKAPVAPIAPGAVLPIPTIDSNSGRTVLTPALNPYQQEIAQHRGRTNAEPWLRMLAEKDSQYAVLRRAFVTLQKVVPENTESALVKLQRDTINSQRRQLAIARSIPSIYRDRNISIPVFLPALDGDTSQPFINPALVTTNTDVFMKDSTYQKNHFHTIDLYKVLRTADMARATISGAGSMAIKQDEPLIGFRVQILGTYGVLSNNISLGIGTRIDYGKRANGGINFMINPVTGAREVSIYAKEDIAIWGK